METKFDKYIIPAFKIGVGCFFILFFIFHASTPRADGDECGFILDLQFVKSDGWISAIQKGFGLTYTLLIYPFSFFLKDYIALRFVNFLLFLLLLLYFYKWGEIKNKMFYYYFLFFSSCGWFLLGTNDPLFVVCLTIFFNEAYKFLNDKKASITLLWCSLILAFFTREVIYVYMPAIIITFFLLKRKQITIFEKKIAPLLLLGILIIINIPSLISNKKLCYDNKLPPKEFHSNWAQRQYLAQLLVNDNKLTKFNHPSWEETDAYLAKNGPNSLPKTILQSIFFDLKLTITETFKNFYYAMLDSIRLSGFPLIIVFLFSFYTLVIKRKFDYTQLYIPFITLMMFMLFCIIIIYYIELRWLLPMFIMTIIYFSELEIKEKMSKHIFQLNYLMFFAIMLYGTIRVIPRL
jgi:hypothetical protein